MSQVAVQSPVTIDPIPLLPVGQSKLRLRLRKMHFAKELDELPTDLKKLHLLLLKNRNQRTETIYFMVSAWNKLTSLDPAPWPQLGFRNEREYLAYYDLPDGVTLAGWTIMVQLFDKPTFLFLGTEVLNFMMRWVGQYQGSSDKRKRDYQEIFDLYSNAHPDGFDKESFYKCVREFVEEKYIKAAPKPEKFRPLMSKRRPHIVEQHQSESPIMEQDFSWDRYHCPACRQKLEVLKDVLAYVKTLEDNLRTTGIAVIRPEAVKKAMQMMKDED